MVQKSSRIMWQTETNASEQTLDISNSRSNDATQSFRVSGPSSSSVLIKSMIPLSWFGAIGAKSIRERSVDTNSLRPPRGAIRFST
eukprot:scaffold85862_cov41-Prasinocladus_malaysianus.AAC.1